MFKPPYHVFNSSVPKYLSVFITIGAITLWPFIFYRTSKKETSNVLIEHESIHIKQYNETYVFGFLVLYIYDWIHGILKYGDSNEAYYRIRFEQEAYANASTENYSELREPFAWRDYTV